MQENRFCDRCMQKTLHEITENEDTIIHINVKKFTNVLGVIILHIKEV